MVATILMVFVRINDQISVNNTLYVTLCGPHQRLYRLIIISGPHSLENHGLDYGHKPRLALGVFIQYNSYLKKAGVQNYA